MTDKQLNYLKSLLIDRGVAHPEYGLRQAGKDLCGVPRSAMSWEGLKNHLSCKQASALISKIK